MTFAAVTFDAVARAALLNLPLRALPLLALPLIYGCAQPCADGWGRAADGNCYPICLDGYAPGDDTGPGGDDTGPSGGDTGYAAFDGSYAGAFLIDVTETNTNQRDDCLGQVTLTFNSSQSPPLEGSFSCGFNESLSSYPGASGTLLGSASGEGQLTGTLNGLSWLQDDFSGQLGDNINGSFTGVVSGEGFTFEYSGSFNGQAQ